MSEFLFKNLSVKLFPATPEVAQPCPACSLVVSCPDVSFCRVPSIGCAGCSLQVTCLPCSTHPSVCCGHSVAASICHAACSLTVSVCGTCSTLPSVCCGHSAAASVC